MAHRRVPFLSVGGSSVALMSQGLLVTVHPTTDWRNTLREFCKIFTSASRPAIPDRPRLGPVRSQVRRSSCAHRRRPVRRGWRRRRVEVIGLRT
jgi:hypothetical protein